MRLAGTIHEENLTRQFGIYLETQGIENRVELSGAAWEVWIRDDDHWPAAKSELAEFLKDPQSERFKVALSAAAQAAHKKQNRPPVIVIRHNTLLGHRPWITTLILILCIAVYFGINMQMDRANDRIKFEQLLQIQDRFYFEPVRFPKSDVRRPFNAIREGEFWRALSPCLAHGGFFHLLFNMLGLYVQGSRIERVRGPIVFTGLVVVVGLFSNTCQYLLNYYLYPEEPPGYFLGFSGVLYGIFGYLWVKSIIEQHMHFIVTEQEVIYMLFWTILCLFQLIDGVSIANTVHLSGGVAGMGLAWIGTMIRRAQGKA